jgi:phage-related protein
MQYMQITLLIKYTIVLFITMVSLVDTLEIDSELQKCYYEDSNII